MQEVRERVISNSLFDYLIPGFARVCSFDDDTFVHRETNNQQIFLRYDFLLPNESLN